MRNYLHVLCNKEGKVKSWAIAEMQASQVPKDHLESLHDSQLPNEPHDYFQSILLPKDHPFIGELRDLLWKIPIDAETTANAHSILLNELIGVLITAGIELGQGAKIAR